MKIRVLAALVTLVVAVSLGTLSFAGQAKKDSVAPAHKIVHDSDLKWTPLIPGSEMAVVSGDPSVEGEPFVIRIRTADGAKVPPALASRRRIRHCLEGHVPGRHGRDLRRVQAPAHERRQFHLHP